MNALNLQTFRSSDLGDTELIARLIDDDPLPHWLGDARPWRRSYGRRCLDRVLRATLVYERVGMPESATRIDVLHGSDGAAIPGIGHVIATPIWDDPALPALAKALRRDPDLRPVRYRPGKRCTLVSRRDGARYLKCFHDVDVAAMFEQAHALHLAANKGAFDFGVARPIGFDAAERIFVQAAVPGIPIVDRMNGADGCALAARIGAANASLVASEFSPALHFSYADQCARTAKYARRLGRFVPEVTSSLERIVTRLASMGASSQRQRPLHGAPHLHQWLDGPDGLMLVDFDRMAWGDPELDAATFIAEADFEPYGRGVNAAYRAAFERVVALDDRLLGAYRAHKHIAKALKMAESIRIDGAVRSVAIISALVAEEA